MPKNTIISAPEKLSGKTRLWSPISVYIIFIVIATGITYHISTIVQKDLADTIALQIEKETLVNEQIHAIYSRHLLIRDILVEQDPFTKDEFISLHAEYARQVLTARRSLQKLPLSREERALINKQWGDSRAGYNTQGDLIERSLNADIITRMKLYREFVDKAQPGFLQRMNELASYRTKLREISINILADAEQNQLLGWLLVIIFYVLTLIFGAIAIFWFNARQHEHQQNLDWQTSHDTLTKLPNRLEFERQLDSSLGDLNTTLTNCVVLYIDLDQFKLINDSSGHAAGDELLRRLGNMLQHSVRSGDLVARLGGDEFGILLHGCDIQHATTIAINVCKQIAKHPFEWDKRTYSLSASIGLVQADDEHSDVNAILKSADIACYTAKDQGGNSAHVYTKDDHISTTRLKELEWVNQIKRALLEDKLVLYNQRIMPMHGDAREFREVLVRMIGYDQGIITPDKFLPIAEKYNLMSDIDLWVVKHTGEYIVETTDLNTCFSINLSGITLSNPERVQQLIQIIKESGANPGLFIFEITETAAISNLSGAVDFMHQIKQLGCRFALDDFGSGLSSFTYLKQMPVDFLKIDGSFIQQLKPETIDFTFVQSIHALAKTMGIDTIAEWVEDKTVMDYLQVLGVDYVQGFYIHAPAPLD